MAVAKVAARPAGRLIVGRPFCFFFFFSFFPRCLPPLVVGWLEAVLGRSRSSASVPAVRSLAAGGSPAAANAVADWQSSRAIGPPLFAVIASWEFGNFGVWGGGTNAVWASAFRALSGS